ncbi:MAG: flavocytochrome c [Syntrophales bacterium]
MSEEKVKESIRISRRSALKAVAGIGTLAAINGLGMHLTGGLAEAAVKKLPGKWDEEYDVVIIGSGFAGLAAAAEAGSRGNKVLIVDKMPILGGNSIINGGGYCAWTDKLNLRKTLNRGEDSAQLHYEDTLKGGDYYNNPALVRILVEQAPEALNWMIDEGDLKLRPMLNRIGGHSAYRGHISIDGTGKPFVDALKKVADRSSAKIRLNTKITWLWRRDWDGPVLGVQAETGRRIRNIKVRKAVIVTSGGFSRDVQLRTSLNPSLVAEYNTTNQPGATGELIRYAQAVGADTLHLAFIQLYPTAEPNTGVLDAWALYPSRSPSNGALFVNWEGKRFVSELERRDVVSRAEIKLGKKPAYTIFDQRIVPMMTTPPEIESGIAKGRVWKADTLAELAKKMDLPPKTVEETVAKHNQYITAGKDPDFNKPITKQMRPLAEAPFYGVSQWPAIHHTMGGLRIDTTARVIDIWGKPIPRLYAAGEVTGGIHGTNRLGGNATAECVVFGRIAGINAAKEK